MSRTPPYFACRRRALNPTLVMKMLASQNSLNGCRRPRVDGQGATQRPLKIMEAAVHPLPVFGPNTAAPGSVAIRNSSIRFLRYVGAKRRVDTRHCGRAILEILIATEPMKTHQNSFNIDYSAPLSNWRFLGSATIARLPTVDFKGRSAKSGYLQSFSTEEQALGHALCWAQRWCDEN